MNARPDPAQAAAEIPELVITRVFDAPRPLVFAAWTKAEHLKHWFSPEHFSVPEIESDARAGGGWKLCMRGPDGADFWSKGAYLEVDAPRCFVLADALMDAEDRPMFEVVNEVVFEEEGEKTRMTLRVKVSAIHDPASKGPLSGMAEGWKQTLDKLERYLPQIGKTA